MDNYLESRLADAEHRRNNGGAPPKTTEELLREEADLLWTVLESDDACEYDMALERATELRHRREIQ